MTRVPPAPVFGDPLPLSPSQPVLDFLARRRSASALTLGPPGPTQAQLTDLLRLAARVPDHGKLSPWRFVVLAGADKDDFAARLEALVAGRPIAPKLVAKLGKLKTPPLAVAVIFSPRDGDIPKWEQLLSTGAVCTNLLHAAAAMGFGANWITDWYAYDAQAVALLGVEPHERVAGFIFIGAPAEPSAERVRPDVAALTARWTPPA